MKDRNEFDKFLGKKVTLMVDVGSEKPFCYNGVVLGINNSFLTLDDDKLGTIHIFFSKIITIQKYDENIK